MKGIYFLVEEPSIRPVIDAIAKKLIAPNGYWQYSGQKKLPKGKTAEVISPFLDLENNRSISFNHFVEAIKELLF